MDSVWSGGPVSAEQCREALRDRCAHEGIDDADGAAPGLEEKGYVTHVVEGRTFVYRAAESSAAVAARTVKHLIDRFCGGSAEALLVGMVNSDVVSPAQLERAREEDRATEGAQAMTALSVVLEAAARALVLAGLAGAGSPCSG